MENIDLRDELIESYGNLPIDEKKKEIGREIVEMTSNLEKLLSDINPNYICKDVDDYMNLFNYNNEDDYLKGLYEDILDLNEAITKYCVFATGLYYEDENNNR